MVVRFLTYPPLRTVEGEKILVSADDGSLWLVDIQAGEATKVKIKDEENAG